jgi:CHAT domain-containing protein
MTAPPFRLATFHAATPSGRVKVTWYDGTEMQLGDRAALARGQARADDLLAQFCRAAPGFERREKAAAALRDLVDGADQLVRDVLGCDAGLRADVESKLNCYRVATQHDPSAVPYIEILGRHDHFPFELLPLFGGTEASGATTDADLLLSQFLGHRVAVRRVRQDTTEHHNGFEQSDGPLPMQFLRYEMEGSAAEDAFFATCKQHLEVDGPWPPSDLQRDPVLDHLVAAIHDPAVRLVGARDDKRPIQIQHFACHCDTEFSTADDFELILGSHPGIRVKLVDIYRGMVKRERAKRVKGARPLVFLNACGGARASAFESFPKMFLDNRARGFVGAAADIPDRVAARYSTCLYEELLAGVPLAEAVVRARIRLWEERGSPLGLLYTFYGDPGLRLVNSTKGSIR